MHTLTRYMVAILLLGTIGVLPSRNVFAFTPGGNSEGSALIGILESVKSVFGQAENLTTAASDTSESQTDLGTWQDTAGRVWGSVKDFFNDRTARGLLLDTLKLFINIVVNIFIIIANLLGRILAAI